MSKITLNNEQQLYVIPCDGGYSCLGYDVCERRANALALELEKQHGIKRQTPAARGTLDRYAQYEALCQTASDINRRTGWRSSSELTPQLIGLENRRVEVVHEFTAGQPVKIRFIVGKSTGFIPCHLELKSSRSSGGGAVCLGDIKSVRVIR